MAAAKKETALEDVMLVESAQQNLSNLYFFDICGLLNKSDLSRTTKCDQNHICHIIKFGHT
jgi:hypothetical protein